MRTVPKKNNSLSAEMPLDCPKCTTNNDISLLSISWSSWAWGGGGEGYALLINENTDFFNNLVDVKNIRRVFCVYDDKHN